MHSTCFDTSEGGTIWFVFSTSMYGYIQRCSCTVGEYGTGWNNSNYWSGQTGDHEIVYPLIAKYSYDIVHGKLKKSDYQKDKDIGKFLQSMLKMNKQQTQSAEKQFALKWKPRSFSNLCEKAVKQRDVVLMEFCQDIANKEWRFLIEHCFQFV